ncbi:thiamine-triphosphatase-like [Acanthaster planci]|uniref:Thiamine-triphosphatase n=1 Tax=Acanthaster planci TaxID=133434 RepID=A0A8B7YFA8_ACAPL|nr:thiamine-triphosphatase-like [Acanthaster planci]
MAGKGENVESNTGPSVASRDHQNVEIERKFTVSVDTETKLTQSGGTCVLVETMKDSYFDSDQLILTMADHWLRRRNGKWELKVPLSGWPTNKYNASETCTKYSEITNEQEIVANLCAIINAKTDVDKHDKMTHSSEEETHSAKEDLSLEKCLIENALMPFAQFTTYRKTYSMGGGILVVVDQTDFGYSVGEIEMMTGPSPADLLAAEAKIEEMAEKLGLGTQTVAAGKMSMFLKKFAEPHYQALLAAGVLQRQIFITLTNLGGVRCW